MDPIQVQGLEKIASPALLFDKSAIESNLDRMIEIVDGEASRLRPHAKTHKCAEILAIQLERGITKVKCATIAEAELAAQIGSDDVLLSYPAIGPTAERLYDLAERYEKTSFSTLVDSAEGLADLKHGSPLTLGVYLDLDVGMSRTGIAGGPAAIDLINNLRRVDCLDWRGIHAYDGHIHDSGLNQRRDAFDTALESLSSFLHSLDELGIPVPSIVSGGSPTFALHAEAAAHSQLNWECSPGTTVLWDAGYAERYPELDFTCAAFLLCRVVSHPGENQICLDLGHKAVSAENPITNRVRFPGLAAHSFVSQSEEHLVLKFCLGERPAIGTTILGVPYHVCPTVALYERACLVQEGPATSETWKIAARDRSIGC